MNHKIVEIIRREYIQRVNKKSFWVSVILMPAIMLGSLFLPSFFIRLNMQEESRIAVIDTSGRGMAEILEKYRDRKIPEGQPEEKEGQGGIRFIPVKIEKSLDETLATLKKEIGQKKWEGGLVIGSDLDAENNFQYYGRSVGNITILRTISSQLEPLVIADRFARNDLEIPPEKLKELTRGIDVGTFQVQESGESKESGLTTAIFMTYGFVLIIYIALLVYGITNLRGILEEKSSRVMEVLLSKFTPREIMTGKLLGIGLVGLTQMGIYALCAGAVLVLGAVNAAMFQPKVLEVIQTVNPMWLVYFIIFFLLGYFIFSAMFLLVGSVCSTEEDANNLQSPIIFMIMIPMFSTFFFITNPDSTIAMIVSFIPVFTPMTMLMRILMITPPLWQILLSIAICLAFLYLLLWFVAKVFRVGILMYGKRPSFKEIWIWFKSA